MRALAEQSRQAAASAAKVIDELQLGARAAVATTEEGGRRASTSSELARNAGSAIDTIATAIRESTGAAGDIAAVARQQSAGVEQMVGCLHDLTSAQTSSLEVTRKVENVARSLQALSSTLAAMVAQYKV
jgi:methyl-accepting chemotaxis protein